MSENVLLDWAQCYAGLGLRVFPLKPREKKPQIDRWGELATTDSAIISGWLARWPSAGVGIATGAGSALVDVETDIKSEVDTETGEKIEINGEESLSSWAETAGVVLPDTWSFRSGGGGIHRLFHCGMAELRNRVGMLPGVDVRANGGYAVFPPSMHPSGRRYEWLPGHSPADMPQGPAPLPFELIALIVGENVKPPLEVPAEVIEGSRNDTLFRLACKLRRDGLEEEEILSAVQAVNENRCIPPLDQGEVDTICRQAAGYPSGELPVSSAPEDAFSATDLMQRQFRPLMQPVAGLICEGLTLLVAASKIGKSWLALLMGICIANGENFLGRVTTKCRVLYLALEDSERRLQSRIRSLQIAHVPENLFLRTRYSKMGEGFEEELESWLALDSSPAVVIIDTLQKIRGLGSKGVDAYKADYETMSKLKAIADRHRAAMVCLHHNNKARQVSDPYDKISGSMAMMGAADTAILIARDRGSDTATVSFTGRDVWGDDFTIRFEGGRWSLVSNNAHEYIAAQKYAQDPLAQTIKRLAQENPTGGRWSYAELRATGIEKVGIAPFSNGKECGTRLGKGLAAELWVRDKIRVSWSVRIGGDKRGVEIEPQSPPE